MLAVDGTDRADLRRTVRRQRLRRRLQAAVPRQPAGDPRDLWRFFAENRYFQGEYYFLLLTSFLGMLLMPSARDLLMLFVALETVSSRRS
jgi:hypothetical protein